MAESEQVATMIFLALITFVNAVVNANTWGKLVHISIGPIDFNVFLLAIVVSALAVPFVRSPSYRTLDNTGNGFFANIALFALALLVGVYGMFRLEINAFARDILLEVRDFAIFPLCMWLGYRLTTSPKVAMQYIWILLIAGVASTIFMGANFVGHSDELQFSGNLELTRDNALISSYAGLAAAVLLYTIVAGTNLMPRLLGMVIAGVCFFGQLIPMNRSDWVAGIAAIAGLMLFLPAKRRLVGLATFVAAGLATVIIVWAGLYLASGIVGRDVFSPMERKVESLNPFLDQGSRPKAWTTRIPSILNDIEILKDHPVLGGGFGCQDQLAFYSLQDSGSFHHNAWTDVTAKAGVLGLAAFAIAFIAAGRSSVQLIKSDHLPFVLIGALGIATVIMFAILGMETYSFNSLRGAIPPALIFGIIAKCRMMQRYYATAEHAQFYEVAAFEPEMMPVHG